MNKVGKLVAAGVVGVALASIALAQEEIQPSVRWSAITAITNTSATAATAAFPSDAEGAQDFRQWLDAVYVDLGGTAGATCTVQVLTAAGSLGLPARTLATITGITSDALYPVRDIVTTQAGSDISNVPARVPVWGFLKAKAYSASTTGVTATVYAILTPRP